ncbi:hypothetical protein D3C72_2007410 [compost metagenome]
MSWGSPTPRMIAATREWMGLIETTTSGAAVAPEAAAAIATDAMSGIRNDFMKCTPLEEV